MSSKVAHVTLPEPSDVSGVDTIAYLNTTQTLLLKTLINPRVSRIVGFGAPPTAVITTGLGTVVTNPVIDPNSSDVSGVLSLNSTLTGGLYRVRISYSTPYASLAACPKAVMLTQATSIPLSASPYVVGNVNPSGFTIIQNLQSGVGPGDDQFFYYQAI
jgi:hypothetical protein